jgi:hypothetical protein
VPGTKRSRGVEERRLVPEGVSCLGVGTGGEGGKGVVAISVGPELASSCEPQQKRLASGLAVEHNGQRMDGTVV